MAKVKVSESPKEKETKKSESKVAKTEANSELIKVLQSIDQNTMDTVKASEATEAKITNVEANTTTLVTGIGVLLNKLEKSKSVTGSSEKASNSALEEKKLNKADIALKSTIEKAESDKQYRQLRNLELAARIERQREIERIQDQDRARRLAEEAKQRLRAEKKEADPAYNYGPIGMLKNGVGAVIKNQPGTTTKAITAALTGGLGNMIGLDKVLGATASGLGKVVGNVLGSPFKAFAKKREQNKADKQAIQSAVHAAELQKKIEAVLEKKGLKQKAEDNTGKVKDTPSAANDNFLTKSKKAANDNKKGSGATKGAAAENPMKGVETRLDKIDNTLKGMSKGGDKKKEEEDKDTFFEKLLSMAGSMLSTLAKNAGSILLVAGAAYVAKKLKEYWEGFNSGMLTYWGYAKSSVGQFIKGVTSKAIGGVKTLIGKVGSTANSLLSKVAPKVSNALSSIANTTKNAFNGLKSALSKAITPIKNIGSKIGSALSKFSNTGVGKVVGKIGKVAGKGVKVFGKVLGPVMSLFETGSVLKDAATKGVAKTVDDYKKNWKWYDYLNLSKVAAVSGAWLGDKAGDLMSWYQHRGKTPQQEIAEMRAKQNGTTVEEELKALQSPAQKAADKQSFTVQEKENSVVYGNVAKQEEQATADKARYEKLADKYTHAAQVNREAGKVSAAAVRSSLAKEYSQKAKEMDNLTGALRTWSENDDMYAVEINKDLLTNSGQLSEEGILILKRQGVSDQQMQQIQNVMNSSVNNSGSNIYQTNVTQYSDKPIYATGDAARTMSM